MLEKVSLDSERPFQHFLQATIPQALLESEPKKTELETAEERNTGISAIFATPNMTRITIVMWINWIVVTVGYYGISLGIGDIGPDVFINFLLVGSNIHTQ